MPSPDPYLETTGEGVPTIYENGRFFPNAWGKAWGFSWGSAWGTTSLIPYLRTSKPYEVTSG